MTLQTRLRKAFFFSNLFSSREQKDSIFPKTRTKTSIRYAKENDREKRERKKGRRRDIEREGEIREIDRERERDREG